jgi:hypothetical protein
MACPTCRALKDAIADRDSVIAALLARAAVCAQTSGCIPETAVPPVQPACVFCGARVPHESTQAWLTRAAYPDRIPADGFYRLCLRCDRLLTEQQQREAARW